MGAVGEKPPPKKWSHKKMKPSPALGIRKGYARRLFGTNSFKEGIV
jgi:hypothetical protein